MASVSTNEFKNGLKLIVEGDPCEILDHEFHKPGKGQAVMRVKFKNLKSNRVWEKTYKTGESLERADLENVPMQFLYESGEEIVMMNNNSFDQESFSKRDLGDSIQWMEEGESYEVLLFEGSPLSVELDTFVEMEVTETEPGFKGDTATGATKPAILKNGIEVKVPLFIEIGDLLKIDTRTCEYQSRVKD